MFKHYRLPRVVVALLAVAPFFALGFSSDSSAVTKFNIKVDPSIELVVQNNLPSITLNSPDGAIHQTTINASVTTNNPTGYTVAVITNNSDLVNQTNPDYIIPALDESVSNTNFTMNKWGILSAKDSLYHPLTSDGLVINSYVAPATAEVTPITFGVKVNSELPSGVYNCDMTVVAIANRIPYTIDTIDFLQDIDEDVIDNMVVGEQHQLMDARDEKTYFVAKLADGNVWMTQNLDFELSAEGTALDPSTTDVHEAKVLTVSTNAATWGQDNTLAYYKDAGDLYRPNGLDTAVDSSALADDSTDQHYQLGSYYSWNAATAGSGAGLEAGAVASESICPKGWKLPTASENIGEANNDTEKVFSNYFGRPVSRYSHTANISDAGVQNGNYENNIYYFNEVRTIPGATRLHIRLSYGGQGDMYDFASFWAGNHPDYYAAERTDGIKFGNNTYGRYGGTQNTVEGFIDGDTVTFSFYSNSSNVGNGYGYYAVITGYDENGIMYEFDVDPAVGASNPFWASYAGKFDSTSDWTAALRSASYWSSVAAGNNQALTLTSQEETASGNTTTFTAHPNTEIDTTEGLNVRCVAKPASYKLVY